MAPEAVCLVIVHNQRIGVKLSRDPKGQFLACDSTVIHDGRIAEGSPGDRDGYAANIVVDDFNSAQCGYWVGATVPIDFDTKDRLVFLEPLGIFAVLELRGENGRDGILREDGNDVIRTKVCRVRMIWHE